MLSLTDTDFLRIAYAVARRSGDLSTQNGAILVDPADGEIVSYGWNDIHVPQSDLPARRQRPLKYEWTEHAERSAILNAARRGYSTVGLWMYCPWYACADCGRAIVLAGITRVVGHDTAHHRDRPDWAASIDTAMSMLREAGVDTDYIEGELGVRFRFAGKDIEV